MRTIGIIGMGLIGGSLAKALKQKKPDTLIIAYNRTEETLIKAKNEGIIDHYTKKINESFSACDIIFICVPVGHTEHIAEQLKKYASKEALVTDVGSTKAEVCKLMENYKDNFTFIGGHPMAGSEQAGYDASKHYLFENAYYPLTPYEDTPQEKILELEEIISETGALPIIMKPETHDFIVGAISHVPHVVAMSLVNAVSKSCSDRETALTLASGGFKDITRVASSSPKMWNDISFQNKKNILKVLSFFKDTLNEYEEKLIKGDEKSIYRLFENAKCFRDEFGQTKRRKDSEVIGVDIEDKPGGISFITTILSYNNINIKNIGIANNRDFGGGILEVVVESSGDRQRGADALRANGFSVY